MNKKLFSLFAVLFIAFLSFTSCSSDNDDNGGGNVITVNTNKFKVEDDASVSFNANNTSLGFLAYLVQEEVDYMSIYDFTIRVTGMSFDDLKKDAELEVEVREYRDFADVGSMYTFEVISGKVTVSSVSDKDITLKFDKFKFKRNKGSYEMNGYINYKKN